MSTSPCTGWRPPRTARGSRGRRRGPTHRRSSCAPPSRVQRRPGCLEDRRGRPRPAGQDPEEMRTQPRRGTDAAAKMTMVREWGQRTTRRRCQMPGRPTRHRRPDSPLAAPDLLSFRSPGTGRSLTPGTATPGPGVGMTKNPARRTHRCLPSLPGLSRLRQARDRHDSRARWRSRQSRRRRGRRRRRRPARSRQRSRRA